MCQNIPLRSQETHWQTDNTELWLVSWWSHDWILFSDWLVVRSSCDDEMFPLLGTTDSFSLTSDWSVSHVSGEPLDWPMTWLTWCWGHSLRCYISCLISSLITFYQLSESFNTIFDNLTFKFHQNQLSVSLKQCKIPKLWN